MGILYHRSIELCYTFSMRTLSETNPYLKDKKNAQLANSRSAKTSCGVEGIVIHPHDKVYIQADSSKTDEIFQKIQTRLLKIRKP